MFYREAGQFKATYIEDSQIFPIRQDRIGIAVILAVAFAGIPLLAMRGMVTDYTFTAILTPFLIFALAALGLNILTGYAGQLSLGTAAFMAVGAFASYNFMLRIEGMPILVAFILGGLCAAAVGIVFGLPSLRIRGFYLAAATLATQFFIVWCLTKVGWFTNYSSSGVITAQKIEMLGYTFDTAFSKYLFVLSVVSVMALLAKNMVRTNVGRSWMAIRDMDMAAEVIGFRPMRTKLMAFAVSSFYCGVAGALFAYAYLGTVEPEGFNLDLSFRILFMVIIGGVGSILGSFFGSAFIVLLPTFLNVLFHYVESTFGVSFPSGISSSIELMVFGALIIFFLIVEPHGLARLWQIGKEKLRLWPFPH
jgi:branched-chain amino acid transport system permease protein